MGLRFFALAGCFILTAVAEAKGHQWPTFERPVAIRKMLANIGRAGTTPGLVVASPQRSDPDYYFHWVRDGALAMSEVVSLYDETGSSRYENLIQDFIALTREQQGANAKTGLGEPKFEVDNRPYMGPWGRPQNDGPALRAITLIRYARIKMSQGQSVADLYDSRFPSRAVIKLDLEYVSHHWMDASFDLWEEVLGDHFYTRMVQRRALKEGAELAKDLGDPGAAAWYLQQADQLSRLIERHWDSRQGLIRPTLNFSGGLDYKSSDLDVAVVLGVLHGHTDDGFFDYRDARVQSTLRKLILAFQNLYAINRNDNLPAVVIGRYPEDRYAGSNFNGGNPWVLATLAVAELYYRQGNRKTADEYLARVSAHAYPDGSLSEQIDRRTGFMTSAADLTWNYAALLSTLRSRGELRSR